MEHGPDGGLPDGGWGLHGRVSGGGAQPLCSLRRRDGGNRALPLAGAAGRGGGGQGEVTRILIRIKRHLCCVAVEA